MAELAILISLFSVLIASISLGWNVYRDVILKPKVVVTVGIKKFIGELVDSSLPFIGVTATNHGPGSVTLNALELRETLLWKRITKTHKCAVLIHDYKNPYSAKMPKKLEVGDSLSLFVDYNSECFLKESFTQIGINDSFGRTNWASKKSLKEVRGRWLAEFVENT